MESIVVPPEYYPLTGPGVLEQSVMPTPGPSVAPEVKQIPQYHHVVLALQILGLLASAAGILIPRLLCKRKVAEAVAQPEVEAEIEVEDPMLGQIKELRSMIDHLKVAITELQREVERAKKSSDNGVELSFAGIRSLGADLKELKGNIPRAAKVIKFDMITTLIDEKKLDRPYLNLHVKWIQFPEGHSSKDFPSNIHSQTFHNPYFNMIVPAGMKTKLLSAQIYHQTSGIPSVIKMEDELRHYFDE